MKFFRLASFAAAAVGLLAGTGSASFANEVEKTLTVSGHVNRAIVASDNGESTTFSQIDNSSVSGSRFRLIGTAKSSSMTIAATTELGVQANGALGSQADADVTSINIRQSFVSLSNNMGILSVGHTDLAEAGITSSKLNGTGEAGFYDDSTIIGEELRITNDTGTASGVTVGAILVDSVASRASTIKYQTPNMAGFKGTIGFANQNNGSAKLDYAADYDNTKVLASAGWGSRGGTAAIKSVWGGSLAVSLAGGLNGSIAYSQRDLNSSVTSNAGLAAPEMFGASLGYTSGASGITGWYQQVEDLDGNNNEAKTYALVVQHNLVDYGTAVYGGIQNVEYKTTGTSYEDLTAGWIGIKVTF